MGRSLKKRVTIQIGAWLVTEQRKSWKVKGQDQEFSLKEVVPRKWNLSYQNTNGSQVRKRFRAGNLEDAINRAIEILPGVDRSARDKSIAEVLAWWIETNSAEEQTINDYHCYNRLILEWSGRNGLKYWRDLEWDHLQRYANELRGRGLRKRTIQLYTLPLRSAARKAARKWRDVFHNFADGYEPPKNAKGPKPQKAKSLEWIAAFLSWLSLEPNGWRVLPGVALQGLCGLRVSEMLRLKWDRVDFHRGTILLDGKVKNENSRRRLPLPDFVVDTLSEAPRLGDRVVSSYSRHDSWHRAVRRFMESFEAGSSIPPKDLRNTLATERRKRLWNKEVMQLYYGQEAESVLDIHYTHLSEEEKISLFRDEVVSRVNVLLKETRDQWLQRSEPIVTLVAG